MKIRMMAGIVGLLMLLCGNAFGKTIQVPDDYSLIQSAIAAAENDDTVLVGDGTYRGPGNTNLNFSGKAITLRSVNGPLNCIIDGQGSSRGFTFKNNEGADTIISGFTIQNGYGTSGGAIYLSGASPTITHCLIIGNKADFGGGGIFCDASSSPTITDCDISDNESTFGGGGGIFIHESTPFITACAITNNRGDQGGGIFCQQSSPLINRCRIQDNSADLGGGGVFCETNSSPSIVNSLINGNETRFGGGGIFCRNASSPTILHCTITQNKAEPWNSVNWGGGIFSQDTSSPVMTHSILWANTPNQWIRIQSSVPIVTYSDVQGGFPGVGNIDSDPRFVGANDYRLQGDSPCIDTGSEPSADLAGREYALSDYLLNTRPQGAGWDMGAYEFEAAACPDCSGTRMVLENVTFYAETNCECLCTESIVIGSGIKVERGATVTIKAPEVSIKSYFQAEEGSHVTIGRL